MDCITAMAAFARSLRDGTELDTAAREHLASCDRCAELLASAKEVEDALTIEEPVSVTPDVAAVATTAERTITGKRFVRLFLNAVGITFILLAFVVIFSRKGGGPAALAVLIFTGVAAFALVLARTVVRSFRTVYKRLKPGRQLSGVCLGLSEATGVHVTLIRLAFVVLAFADGAGIVVYVLLDLLMPMHPDDRQHLWRFRIARAWRQWRGAEP